ncbi:shikimate 5-dehydrogenase [Alkalihalophilus pseudofirmus OF4]|uniref:Shikimate dehydrogenase (NADP(+)) n=1 Tax=Alkalihalophilus pseudofirmus (strain ATCC BAA-2126 / JCM 17055 / OF4) TaxID=398511 RepID=D3FXI7_ALKPO|nr:shikimate dehydrogenase [Alkalihalophilus pseudofirmus]ADC50698.1 shikimate 5-dehydrogenase [Alkalihalophilus pseudofirmus OF4]
MGKRFGLIGHPVAHSMSPQMHNDAFRACEIDADYEAIDVEAGDLEEVMEKIRIGVLDGVNVTIPHKVAIMSFIDEIDREAERIGAVNTIVRNNGKLVGYNTDGAGYMQSIEPYLPSNLHDINVLVIGAGGAARAVCASFLGAGVSSLVVANRTKEKADTLLNLISTKQDQTNAMTLSEAEKGLERFDIIVNTTSVGMSPYTEQKPISLTKLKDKAIVSDLIYNPLETAFLKEAAERGAITVNGVGMFVNQGALSFEYWTGIKPDRKRMTNIVLKTLGG